MTGDRTDALARCHEMHITNLAQSGRRLWVPAFTEARLAEATLNKLVPVE